MVIDIKKDDTPQEVERKLKNLFYKIETDKKNRLNELFNTIRLNEDPVTLQRRWRDDG